MLPRDELALAKGGRSSIVAPKWLETLEPEHRYINICIIYIYMYIYIYVCIYIYGNRQNYGKKHVQLRQAAPASDFSIIGFFPIRVQNIPEVIRTFFFSIILGGGHYFHN